MRTVTLLLLSLLLGACATKSSVLQRVPVADAPFAFNGRLTVKQGMMRDASGLRWAHNVDDEILLLGPLGYTAGRIHRDAQGATLDDAYGKHYAAPDAEALMAKALGWSVPLNGLRYWVFAAPAPQGEARVERNDDGQISVLYQQGWKINYLRYASKSVDALPLQLNMSRDELEVGLKIDEWEAQ